MPIDTLKALIVSCDAKATEGFGAGTGNYTVWKRGSTDDLEADETVAEEKYICYVERFTKLGNDSVVTALDLALKNAPDIAIREHVADYELDTKYVHHTWTIEVI